MAGYFGAYTDCLSVVGAISACCLALVVGTRTFRVLCRFIGRRFPVDVKQYGRWAVITGCTEGIGKSYALQLAEKGMDVVLISNIPQDLSVVAEHIVQQYKVSVKVITADFKNTDIYDGIKKQLSGLDIGILVNNVGISNRRTPSYFCEADDFEQFNRDIINVNVLSYVMMTTIVLPDMLERKRGAIISISSFAGLRPLPFISIYSATKAFGRFFSEALNMEYSCQGVIFQAVSPSLVQTRSTELQSKITPERTGWFYPTSDDFVRAALKTLGHESCTTAYWPHELERYVGLAITTEAMMKARLLEKRNRMTEFLKSQ